MSRIEDLIAGGETPGVELKADANDTELVGNGRNAHYVGFRDLQSQANSESSFSEFRLHPARHPVTKPGAKRY